MKTTGGRVTAVMALVSWIGIAACQQPPREQSGEAAAVDTAEIEAAIDSNREAFEQAIADGDWQKLNSLAADDLVMILPGGATWDTIMGASAGPYPAGAHKEINPLEVRVLNEDWVYELGTSTVTWTPQGADKERTVRYSYLVLHHRTEDGWKVKREVASSRLPQHESR